VWPVITLSTTAVYGVTTAGAQSVSFLEVTQ
jgi:hypothetical protein